MLARQVALRRTAITAIPAHRNLLCRVRPTTRQISFLPWRRQTPSPNLPVYFPKSTLKSNTSRISFRQRLGRAIATAVILYSCWQIFLAVVLDPLLDWADAEWETLSDKEKEEVQNMADEDEPMLFLPFPFTTTEVKQPPYRGSDPEWQTFVKINQDKKLQHEIRFGLADEIKRGVEKNPGFVKLLGGGTISLRKLWLDIIYPAAPPPEHYVSGIMIDDEGIFWGERLIDPVAARHLAKVVYPKAVALTAWTFVSFLVGQTVQDVSRAIGLGEPSPPEPTWQSAALERFTGEQAGFPNMPKQTVKVITQSDRPPHGSFPAGNGDVLGTLFGVETQLDPRLQAAIQAASLTFAKNWKPTKSPPTRGCIRVDGVVEIKGNSACLGVYVLGWYDPKQRKFVGIQTGLKHLLPLKQKPAPG